MQVGVRRVKRPNAGRPKIYVNESPQQQEAKITLPSVSICELSYEDWYRSIEEKINDHKRRSKGNHKDKT